ncbi:hypothetical protein [Flavivirga rizhaonensis]|uniref:Uncharacterized protein n=1 Tax=Flavivirga rizhaonensis TaxID=2559571 RepID=A0A4V3P4E1_9FLAO|nr:hypothetical protein [Flavivirga rizhaonensis]TGV01024.1 hypothetical protein EM932_17305 [Flavivirga rizhaonensis]
MTKKSKKILKIISGIVVFLTLPSLLFFGFLFFKFNEDLPNGIQGEEADALAYKMLEALDYDAFKKTNYIEWTFKKRHHYEWDRSKNTCEVYWKEFKVNLDLNDHSQSKAFIHSFKTENEMGKELIAKAFDFFNNDSFWLVAPYKVFDKGTERRLVKLENGDDALLITYTTGGSTPGDSYLWLLDNTGKPTACKMWTSILPIEGLEASWSDWTTTESGAQLPTFHKLLVLGIEINHIKGTQ